MIRWNEDKNLELKQNRGISFEEIAETIIYKGYIDILENSSRPEQMVFVINHNNYTWIVPFILENDDTIFLKTAFPSRKFHKKYGDKNEQKEN
jgi:uncharacterized DUF497 family protein